MLCYSSPKQLAQLCINLHAGSISMLRTLFLSPQSWLHILRHRRFFSLLPGWPPAMPGLPASWYLMEKRELALATASWGLQSELHFPDIGWFQSSAQTASQWQCPRGWTVPITPSQSRCERSQVLQWPLLVTIYLPSALNLLTQVYLLQCLLLSAWGLYFFFTAETCLVHVQSKLETLELLPSEASPT